MVALLLERVDADDARLSAARAACRTRHLDDVDDGYPEAEQLVSQARQILAAAGADTDDAARQQFRDDLHAEMHPEPVPFQWDRGRRQRIRWWLRRLLLRRARITHRRARITHRPALGSDGVQRLSIELGDGSVGRMRYQVCDECRLVMINDLFIDAAYQGLNLGTRLVSHGFAQYPDYAWHTTPQFTTAGTFWPRMAQRTGAAFSEASRCAHMSRDGRAA